MKFWPASAAITPAPEPRSTSRNTREGKFKTFRQGYAIRGSWLADAYCYPGVNRKERKRAVMAGDMIGHVRQISRKELATAYHDWRSGERPYGW